jgi:chemotaxis protein methyltransferase CheR
VTGRTAQPRRFNSADPDFQRLKRLIIARTGHHYYEDKDDLLAERLARRLLARGLASQAAYANLLEQDEGGSEWDALEAEITIGETFFFRYAEQFAALKETILPDILERNAGSRRIRIWSAGCSTGAEPYSIAILLDELLGTERDDWRVAIIGTDINATALAAARKGVFGQWALRSMPEEQRRQWFDPDDSGKLWTLKRSYRSRVQFERHNLMTLVQGTSPLQFTDFDLILCRNVLIYFHHDTAAEIVKALRGCLVEGGWLLIGHAEPNPLFAEFFQARSLPGTVAYRNLPPLAGTPRAPILMPLPAQAPVPAVDTEWRPLLPLPSDTTRPSLDTSLQTSPDPGASSDDDDVGADIATVRQHADVGNFAGALGACRSALAHRPEEARLHFYHGLILRAAGELEPACAALRRALYLDPDFIMAHYHLGLALLEAGDKAAGRRSIVHAAGLAGPLDPKTLLDEGDGLAAGMLKTLARLALDELRRDAGTKKGAR